MIQDALDYLSDAFKRLGVNADFIYDSYLEEVAVFLDSERVAVIDDSANNPLLLMQKCLGEISNWVDGEDLKK